MSASPSRSTENWQVTGPWQNPHEPWAVPGVYHVINLNGFIICDCQSVEAANVVCDALNLLMPHYLQTNHIMDFIAKLKTRREYIAASVQLALKAVPSLVAVTDPPEAPTGELASGGEGGSKNVVTVSDSVVTG